MFTLHKMVTTLLSPPLTLGSEVWWTGACHIIANLNLTYHRVARLVTGLPSYTRTDKLLSTAGIPLLQALLDMKSNNYVIRILISPNDYPNKTLLWTTRPRVRVSMGPIKAFQTVIIPPRSRLEKNTAPLHFMPAEDIVITHGNKKSVATSHSTWLRVIPDGSILFTDGFRNNTTSASGWYVGQCTNG